MPTTIKPCRVCGMTYAHRAVTCRGPVRVTWNGRTDGPARATDSTGSKSPTRALVIRSEWLTRDAADIRARLLSRSGHALWTYYCNTGDTRAHSATGTARVTREDVAHAAYLHLVAMVDDVDACAYDIATRTPSVWWNADTETVRTRGYMLTRAISRAMATCRMRADVKAREQLAIDGQRTMGGDATPRVGDVALPARVITREVEVADATARMIRETVTRDALNGSREGMAIARALGMLTDGAALGVAADRARAIAAGEYRSQWTSARGRLSRYASRVLSDAQATYADFAAML